LFSAYLDPQLRQTINFTQSLLAFNDFLSSFFEIELRRIEASGVFINIIDQELIKKAYRQHLENMTPNLF